MSERSDQEDLGRIERVVEELFQRPRPEPAFAKRLKRQLVARGPAVRAERIKPALPLRSAIRALGWTAGILLMALALIWGINNLVPNRFPGVGVAGTPTAKATNRTAPTSLPAAQMETPSPTEPPLGVSTGAPPLSMDSSTEEIRQRILRSHTFWDSLWADGQIVMYPPDGSDGPPQSQRVQVWIVQPAKARILSGAVDGDPGYLFISDGKQLRTGEPVPAFIQDGAFSPPEEITDTVYPHPMTGFLPTPLSELLFPSGLAQRQGSFQVVGEGSLAGRQAVVVEWSMPDGQRIDRFWVDARTGVILRQQNYGKGGGGALTGEIVLNAIQYDLDFPPETFERVAAFPPAYAGRPDDIFSAPVTVSGTPGPSPAIESTPQAADNAGEVYLLLDKNGYEMSGLVHFPAGCLVTGEPCPRPEFVPGFPSEDFSNPLAWSPDGKRLAYSTSAILHQVLFYDRSSGTWEESDSPFFTTGAVWSPDGDWLVGQPIIYGDATSNPFLLVRADGKEWRTILEDEPGFKYHPGWLDENRFIFLQVLDNVEPSFHAMIQRYDLQRDTLTQLADIPYEKGITGPVLSPDKTRLVYGVDKASPYQITVLNIPDSSAVTIDVPIAGEPEWSPDGNWLAITAALGYSCEIHLVNPATDETHKVFTGDWGGACGHAWSPDGNYILVSAYAQNPTVPRLYLVSVPGGESRLVELPDVGVEFEWPRVYWLP